jgi:hypothetical protein
LGLIFGISSDEFRRCANDELRSSKTDFTEITAFAVAFNQQLQD